MKNKILRVLVSFPAPDGDRLTVNAGEIISEEQLYKWGYTLPWKERIEEYGDMKIGDILPESKLNSWGSKNKNIYYNGWTNINTFQRNRKVEEIKKIDGKEAFLISDTVNIYAKKEGWIEHCFGEEIKEETSEYKIGDVFVVKDINNKPSNIKGILFNISGDEYGLDIYNEKTNSNDIAPYKKTDLLQIKTPKYEKGDVVMVMQGENTEDALYDSKGEFKAEISVIDEKDIITKYKISYKNKRDVLVYNWVRADAIRKIEKIAKGDVVECVIPVNIRYREMLYANSGWEYGLKYEVKDTVKDTYGTIYFGGKEGNGVYDYAVIKVEEKKKEEAPPTEVLATVPVLDEKEKKLQLAKKLFPVGTVFNRKNLRSAHPNDATVIVADHRYASSSLAIIVSSTEKVDTTVYKDGKWAKIIKKAETKEETPSTSSSPAASPYKVRGGAESLIKEI